MGFRIVISKTGFDKVPPNLGKLAGALRNPRVPMLQCAAWLAGETIRAFQEGGRPEKWVPISMMTAFIRAKRASGAKSGNLGLPGNDSGGLKNSFLSFVDEGGQSFGAGTAMQYAEQFQKGGISKPNEVEIGPFWRRQGKVHQWGGGMTMAGRRIRKGASGGMVHVKGYIMHLKGGHSIPARPFFPTGMDGLRAWGYTPKFQEIFAVYFGNAEYLRRA